MIVALRADLARKFLWSWEAEVEAAKMTTHNARRRVMVVVFTHVRSNKQIVLAMIFDPIVNFVSSFLKKKNRI